MDEQAPRLILASGSPRRRRLLGDAGFRFEIMVSDIDETPHPHERAREYSIRLARAKALKVSARARDALVLGADTIVERDGEIMGKPEGAAGARRMLLELSGRAHNVITAFALARGGTVLELAAVQSRVTFRPLNLEEIEAYIGSGEPFDKAGAYGIQGLSAGFVAGVEGSRDNVMGLPVRELIEALARHRVRPEQAARPDCGDDRR